MCDRMFHNVSQRLRMRHMAEVVGKSKGFGVCTHSSFFFFFC